MLSLLWATPVIHTMTWWKLLAFHIRRSCEENASKVLCTPAKSEHQKKKKNVSIQQLILSQWTGINFWMASDQPSASNVSIRIMDGVYHSFTPGWVTMSELAPLADRGVEAPILLPLENLYLKYFAP